VSIFERIEQACAAFVERTFAKTFPSDLEPTQIARKLVATMEAHARSEDGRLVAPSAYLVRVNPDDYDRLAEHQAYLEREWAELLRELAGRVAIRFSGGDPSVEMLPSESIPAGAVEIGLIGEETIAIDPSPQRTVPRRFQLRMLKGVPAYGVYLIEGRAQVGRAEECDIFLVDPSVSRSHAIVDIEGLEPVVHDLGSTNGTFVNGERVEVRPLAVGDELMFGNTKMRFEATGEAR
jgi:hypothetical protein